MESPLQRPTPSYPANYSQAQNSSTVQDSPNHATPVRKNSSGLNLSSLGMNRDQSFLSLASLNLAHSSSSLLGIFSSALDSVPPTPLPTPPIELRRASLVIEEVDKWRLVRDVVRSCSLLFALGYAFAKY
jgi:hypothetical protein